MVATSSSYSEIIAIHKASRECFRLRQVIHLIQSRSKLKTSKENPTIIYKDNAACIAQLQGGFIKDDRTKHISQEFFDTHELQKNSEIDVKHIQSSKNLANLFTKSLPTTTFKKLIQKIGMRRLQDLTS